MTSFSTTFATVENPISDGGQLITSTSPGVDWSGLALGGSGTLPVAPVDVVAPGEAESVDYANPNYGDALAVATGAWAPDQSASVVVGNIPAQSGGYEEIEVHLRTDPTTGAGYEITWGYNNDYIAVATWNATGGYTNLSFAQGSQYHILPGDTLTASIQGNVITIFTNGAQVAQVTDHNNTFTSGNPGFGFNQGGTAAYAISSFSATDSGAASPPPPPPPIINSFLPDTAPIGDSHTTATSITLSGIGEANSTVNLFDGTQAVGQTMVNSSGAWSISDSGLALGLHNFTATDTDTNGTSKLSSVFSVTIDSSSSPPPPNNLVVNGDFETGNFSGWKLEGFNHWQTFIVTDAESGNYAADLGTVGGEAALSQTLQTVVGQQYELSFWLADLQAGANENFYAIVGGNQLYSEINPTQAHDYVEHIVDFTATTSTTTLRFEYRNDPSDWHLDNVSVVGIRASDHLT